ncbi:MAG TPA: DUF4296 domain-containing protein [Saprospiraceae bacterium]|nr:DUF4296 domain-containing protein [Saprospiraceae bacterium]HMQ84251.1 DUF4296 domain-containing protein [Saprospiraceae bacterium]
MMQKLHYIIYAFLMLLLNDCKQNPAIDATIPEKKLVSALVDLHIAEVAVKSLRGATKDSMLNVYYDQVFEIHGLDREETEAYLEKMRENPEYWNALYEKVQKEHELLDAKLKDAETKKE